MRLSFFNRNEYVYFSVTHNYKRIRVATGIMIPDGATFSDGTFKGKNSDELNEFLAKKRLEIYQLWRENQDLDYIKKMYKPEYYKKEAKSSFDLIHMMEQEVLSMKQSNRHSKNTITNYYTAFKHLNTFSWANGSLDLTEHAVDYKDSIHVRKSKADRYLSYFKRFNDYLADGGYSQPSRAIFIRNVCVLINNISERYYLTLPTIPVPSLKQSPVSILNPGFVSKFVSDEYAIYQKLDDNHKYAWEIAATILVTTFRISDAQSLSMKDITEKDGKMFIIKLNKKTGEHSYLPLPDKLASIYRQNHKKNGHIYTIHESGFYVPNLIREVLSEIPEMQDPMTIRKIGVNGEEVIKTMPTYQAVHPHMLRRTAITTMIYMGVNERHIKFASGHSHNSKSFERYAGFVEKFFQNDFNNYYERLGI